MERTTLLVKISELRTRSLEIEFPEYQREPDVWSRDQKQRLIDSMLRDFDISVIYLYERPDKVWECIDGRQRLNAIMSCLNLNPSDERDNGFPLRFDNEIVDEGASEFAAIEGLGWKAIVTLSEGADDRAPVAQKAIRRFEDYQFTAVVLSSARTPDEFNLQFLRLNLGTLINAGEKLHAMVGGMRDLVFGESGFGKHQFFDDIRVPNRRYAKEVTATQVLLQVFALKRTGEFARGRHLDLQKFVKANTAASESSPFIGEVRGVLDALVIDGEAVRGSRVGNRAVAASLVILAVVLRVGTKVTVSEFWRFVDDFFGRHAWQLNQRKALIDDQEYGYMADFQRAVTQASVEKPAFELRHAILSGNFARWSETSELVGDQLYRERVGEPASA